MLNPLDYVPEGTKQKLVDAGLTRMANAAARSGSTRLAKALRDLRGDTPFIEDVCEGLERALDEFVAEWSVRDPELTALMIEERSLWQSADFLGDLATVLLRPTPSGGPQLASMRARLLEVVAGRVREDRVDDGLRALVAKVRDELFAHPKLQQVHGLFLQRTAVEGNVAILAELRAIRQDNATILTALASPGTGRAALSSGGGTAGGDAAEDKDPEQPPIPAPPRPRLPEPPSRPAMAGGAARPYLPDIFTPALDGGEATAARYEPLVGRELSEWLAGVQSRVTDCVERGDFLTQQGIAEEILATDTGLVAVEAGAYYLLGESQRLQAGLAENEHVSRRLTDAAFESYSVAADMDPPPARALRGQARVNEMRGDIGEALTLYARARAAALHALADGGDSPGNETAHEVLRSTRHYAACLSQVVSEDPRSSWSTESRRLQLHGLILESDELHRDIIPRFPDNPRWMQIEWFMGLVFLAKGYAAVNDMNRAWLSLLHALSARMEMMDPAQPGFSPVERGNLLWWCGCARGVRVPGQDFGQLSERIAHALKVGDTALVWADMHEVILPIQTPWAARGKRLGAYADLHGPSR